MNHQDHIGVQLSGQDKIYPEHLDREHISEIQLHKLQRLCRALAGSNAFYSSKWLNIGSAVPANIEDFKTRFPFSTKGDWIRDQAEHPPYGTNLTFPSDRYIRCHQTSGSTGMPLRWLDTQESWHSMLVNWQEIFRAAGLQEDDRLFFAFSFGPFIGFWSAFESASRFGYFCLPGGAMNSEARIRAILDHQCTVLLCTPTYAMHLGDAAAALGIDLRNSRLRMIITAGEPGGSLPATRVRLGSLWPTARVFDHHGMTESGPVTYECPAQPCVLHVIETSFLAEVIDPETTHPVSPGKVGELVLTTLDRIGSPLVRHRTGDLVREVPGQQCKCGRHQMALQGGILGRADDMLVIRGVNVYPGAVDNIIRSFKQVAEYRVTLENKDSMLELAVEIEPTSDCHTQFELAERIQRAFQTAFALRIPTRIAPMGSLPRFEMKGKRWIRKRA